MLLSKTNFKNRFLAFLLCIILVFVIIASPLCTARAYAVTAVVTVVGVAALLVIGTILVGLGIEVVDPGAFENLCKQVHEKLQAFAVVRDEIFLSIFEGRQYVENQLIVNIAKILFDLQAFTPKPLKTLVFYGLTLNVYDDLVESYFGGLNTMYRFKNGKIPNYSSFKSYEVQFPQTIGESTAYINLGDSGFKYYTRRLNSNSCQGYLFYLNSDTDPRIQFSENLPSKLISITSPFIVEVDNEYHYAFLVKTSEKIMVGVQYTRISGSISAETSKNPWNVKNPPVISADTGDIALPPSTTWADNPAVSLPGVSAPSIPITVPSDLEGLKGMPQTDVMTGNPSKTDNPTADKAISKEQIDKLRPNLGITDFFPFCIPFDLYKGLVLLSASPVEPKWNFIIDIGYVEPWNFMLDLTQYEKLFIICRWFLTVLFCLGLATATHRYIKW